MRAEVAVPGGQAGPAYADSGSGPVHPTLVLTDDQGRSLALNGTACGFWGEGPRGTARILAEEGLLPASLALPLVGAVVSTAVFICTDHADTATADLSAPRGQEQTGPTR